MDNVELQEGQTKQESLLGCTIQANLKWSAHFEHLKCRLSSRLAALSNLKFSATFDVKKRVADGIFTSVLSYCLPLFGGSEACNIKDLQVLQNRAAQIVCKAPSRCNRVKLFDKVKWLTVNQLIAYQTLVAIYKIRESREPEYMSKIVNNTSRGNRILRTNTRLSLAQKSFTFRGVQLWNQLPLDLRTTDTAIGYFKTKAKEWVIDNVPRFLD